VGAGIDGGSMNEQLNKTEARQGEPKTMVRRTLVISTVLAVVAVGAILLFFIV
jgi:hypothetical protein